MKRLLGAILALVMISSLAACGGSREEGPYPSRNIQGTVMWSAGGVCDIVSRAAGLAAQEELGQTIVFTNRAGSGGGVATAYVNAKAADGYELLFGAENPQIAKVMGSSDKVSIGDNAEVISPGCVGKGFTVTELYDEKGAAIESAPHPNMKFYVRVPFEVTAGDIMRSGE